MQVACTQQPIKVCHYVFYHQTDRVRLIDYDGLFSSVPSLLLSVVNVTDMSAS